MSQSLAREFGPQGIHVSHAIIDGIIDTEKTKGFMQDKPDGKIDPNWVGALFSKSSAVQLLTLSRLPSPIGSCTLNLGRHSLTRLI